jgi:hypothetical protein
MTANVYRRFNPTLDSGSGSFFYFLLTIVNDKMNATKHIWDVIVV